MQMILRGQLVDFSKHEILHIEHAAIAIDHSGRIAWRGNAKDLPHTYANWPVDDFGRKFLAPGFVDAHIHFPQYRMLAAPARDLLEWLNRYTFPEEARYANAAYAVAAADVFLNRLFANGTTSALAFCSSHRACADALFAAAENKGMALATGKTMMDRNAIPAVQDDSETGARETQELHKMWHGRSRLRHAITPRFAITSTEAQLKLAGELCKELHGALMQTHLSESAGEIEAVKQLFPNARDYTDVYDQFGLLGPHSVFAHGIHLSDRELARLSESGSSVIHCPTSNAFLGSGIMPMKKMQTGPTPVQIGLATDVGGGTSFSMLMTMAETYKLQMLRGQKLAVGELFHMATLGNAKRLRMDHELGSLEVGKYADVIVLDSEATPVLAARQQLSNSVEDTLFAVMMLGDDRAVHTTFVAGKKCWDR